MPKFIYVTEISYMQKRQQYLLRMQFLGFRFSGWQYQPGGKTVEGMLRKTLEFVLPDRRFKLLGAGRTDARVSALDFGVQFILWGAPLVSEEVFQEKVNENLPVDLYLASVKKVPSEFNAIKDCGLKTYRYFFVTGVKPHPFCAPFFGYFRGTLDIQRMTRGAMLFEGTHDFDAFITKSSDKKTTRRSVDACILKVNREFTANFFPENSYYLEVKGVGFGRYQVRNMMTALVALGRGQVTETELRISLDTGDPLPIREIVPASGLQLVDVCFTDPSL